VSADLHGNPYRQHKGRKLVLADRAEALGTFSRARGLAHLAATRDDEELQLPRRARQERARDLFRSLHRGVRDSQAAGVETGEPCLIGYLIRAASRSLRQLTAASCSATASVSGMPGSSGRLTLTHGHGVFGREVESG
jgi:hypothetical protein